VIVLSIISDYVARKFAEEAKQGGIDVLWYFKCPTTKKIRQNCESLAASNAWDIKLDGPPTF